MPNDEITGQPDTDMVLVQDVMPENTAPSRQTRSKFNRLVDFIKRHKIALVVVISTTFVLVLLYVLIPVISLDKLILTNAGTTLRIEQGQTARLKVSDVSVTVVHFTDEACPTGKTCFGSGQKAVEYRLVIDGQKYATGSTTPLKDTKYQIETVGSDYKTYANIKIVKLK